MFLLIQWITKYDEYGDDIPYGRLGKPRLRWDDELHAFCQERLNIRHWCDLEHWSPEQIDAQEDRYVQYCNEKLG